jgi:hypothetical protein
VIGHGQKVGEAGSWPDSGSKSTDAGHEGAPCGLLRGILSTSARFLKRGVEAVLTDLITSRDQSGEIHGSPSFGRLSDKIRSVCPELYNNLP